MEELDPRLAGTADYLRKIVAQLASIVSRLEPEESNNEYASLKSDVLDLRLMIKAVIERLDDPAYVVKVPNRDEIAKRMKNASADDERNKRIAALEAKVQGIAECEWSAERVIEMLSNKDQELDTRARMHNARLNALEKLTNNHNTTIDNLCGRLEALEKNVENNYQTKAVAREWRNAACQVDGAFHRNTDVKLGNLTSALNDLHSRLADIEGNAVLIRDGVIVPTRKG